MNADRMHTLVTQLQAEIGACVAGNGSVTLHFQNGRVQAVEVLQHLRVPARLDVDKVDRRYQTVR
jgi:hypothetical protein